MTSPTHAALVERLKVDAQEIYDKSGEFTQYGGHIRTVAKRILDTLAALAAAPVPPATPIHLATYGEQSAATVPTACGVECSTWDKPLQYAWDVSATTCVACLRAKVAVPPATEGETARINPQSAINNEDLALRLAGECAQAVTWHDETCPRDKPCICPQPRRMKKAEQRMLPTIRRVLRLSASPAPALHGEPSQFINDLIARTHRTLPAVELQAWREGVAYGVNATLSAPVPALPADERTFGLAVIQRAAAYVRGFTVPPPKGQRGEAWDVLQQCADLMEAQSNALLATADTPAVPALTEQAIRNKALEEVAAKLDEIASGPFTGDGIIGPLHAVGLASGFKWAANTVRKLASEGT